MKIYNLKVIVKTFLASGYLRLLRLTYPGAGDFTVTLALGFIFSLIYACGENVPIGANSTGQPNQNWQMIPLPDTPKTMLSVKASAPSNTCPHSTYYLAGDNFSWNIVTGYDFAVHDVIQFHEDCTMRTFDCGTVGYIIDGGTNWGSGIVHIMTLGHIIPKEGCGTLGEQSCSYTVDGANQLRWNCQLIKPLESQFIP